MGNQACPMCFAKLPRTAILANSLEVNCAACHAELEVSRGSRVLASFVGVLAGYAAARLSMHASGTAQWTLPTVAAFLTFGICSAVVLLVFADLVVRPKISPTAFPHIHA